MKKDTITSKILRDKIDIGLDMLKSTIEEYKNHGVWHKIKIIKIELVDK